MLRYPTWEHAWFPENFTKSLQYKCVFGQNNLIGCLMDLVFAAVYNVCVCVCIYIYIYMYMHACVCVYTWTVTCVCVCTWIVTCVCVFMNSYMCVCAYLNSYMCLCVYMHIQTTTNRAPIPFPHHFHSGKKKSNAQSRQFCIHWCFSREYVWYAPFFFFTRYKQEILQGTKLWHFFIRHDWIENKWANIKIFCTDVQICSRKLLMFS